MSLVNPDLTFNRSAIMTWAWEEWRIKRKLPASYGHTFAKCLKRAWSTAKFARENFRCRPEEDARRAAEEARWLASRTSLTEEQRKASDAWIIASCSTDGRLPDAAYQLWAR